MSRRRSSVCTRDGCPEFAVKDGRCADHPRPAFGGARGRRSVARRSDVYNSPRWRALRRLVRREQPFCARDPRHGPWTDLDHIVPLNEGGAPFDRANVEGLCKACHSAKTSREIHGRAGDDAGTGAGTGP